VKRVLLVDPGRFELEKVSIPEPDPDGVVLKVERCGICGSDVHIYRGSSIVPLPFVLGHEFAGTIYSVGVEIKDFQVGERVAVEPSVWCGTCSYCQSGRYNLCDSQHTYSEQRRYGGAYADYVRVAEKNLIPLSEDMSFKVGAMLEPTACAMHALDAGNIAPGDVVLVIGAGTMGLLIAQAVRTAGADGVVVVDVVPERLAVAKQLGADAVADVRETDLVLWTSKICGKGGINRIFDTASTPQTFDQALNIVRRGGRIINVGVSPQPVEWHSNWLLEEIELTGIYKYTRRDFDDAIQAITNGRIQVEPLISACYPLIDIEEAYYVVLNAPDCVIKVMLAPHEGAATGIVQPVGVRSLKSGNDDCGGNE